MKKNKIIYLTFYFPPDQSAGSKRSLELTKALTSFDKNIDLHVITSKPNRYGQFTSENKRPKKFNNNGLEVKINSLWVPYLGDSLISTTISYLFFFFQVIPIVLRYKPNIIISTSAKLMTGFLGTFLAKFTGAKAFIDLRDTFSDNFFYFYRWEKKIFLIPIFIFIENYIFKNAESINLVSKGFLEAYYGWDKKIKRRNKLSITHFSNGLDSNFRNKIQKNAKHSFDNYKLIYAGNLGEAQDLYSLLKKISFDEKIIKKFIKNKIIIHIYGSGSQLGLIVNLLNKKNNLNQKYKISDFIKYKGLVKQSEITKIYSDANCLLLPLSQYKSLSMVIPTKLFEYCSTNCPIIFSANGFTEKLITNLDATIRYNPEDLKSFFNAVIISMNLKINMKTRNKFLERYNSEKIYNDYAKFILENK